MAQHGGSRRATAERHAGSSGQARRQQRGRLLRVLEKLVADGVAGLEPETLGGTAGEFETGRHLALRRDDGLRQRLGPRFDAVDYAVAADEHHVERNVRVPHPHRDVLRRVVEEQHALIVRELGAEHQAFRLLFVRLRDFHGDLLLPCARDERHALASQGQNGGHQAHGAQYSGHDKCKQGRRGNGPVRILWNGRRRVSAWAEAQAADHPAEARPPCSPWSRGPSGPGRSGRAAAR